MQKYDVKFHNLMSTAVEANTVEEAAAFVKRHLINVEGGDILLSIIPALPLGEPTTEPANASIVESINAA